MMSRSEPPWITGAGAATPLGSDFDTIAQNLLAGRSGVGAVRGFDTSAHPSQIAAQIDRVPCPAGWECEAFGRKPRLEQLALWCCAEALRDAGWLEHRSSVRLGLILGLGAEWSLAWEEDFFHGGARVYDPPQDADSLVEILQRELEISGPALALSAACASGNHALALAKTWLELGWVDVCLAGACDMAVTPMALASFGNLRALSRRNAEPAAASRPFDRGRDGFVLGEGGAVFVLESAAAAQRRGARPLASVAGFGATSDAYHPVIPNPDPGPAIGAVRQALDQAALEPDQIDYVNAHATGTLVGDAIEAAVLRAILGEATQRVPVSSTKSMTGHLVTAAGAMEALACSIAIRHRALPPTINLVDPDPECDLCHVRGEARPQRVRAAISNSFGFGGSNTCLVLRAV
jgi:3-oxoacyl-[acyl-carrier-protein] synthase II